METISKPFGTATILLVMLSACSSQPTNTESEFGKAVRSVMANQIHNVGSATSPAQDAVTGGNPDRLENVVKSHAENVGDAGRVQAPVSVGGGSRN